MYNNDQYIIDNYLTITVREMAREINRSRCYINGRMKALNLVIPEEVKKERIAKSNFKKGDIPFTKGKKQSEFMSAESIEKTKATRFKKGIIPHNTKSDGFISVRKDKDGRRYQWIRTGLNQWIHYHRYLWETEHGSVPNGYCVFFADGNSLNCQLENLILISRQELLHRNKAKWLVINRVLWADYGISSDVQKRYLEIRKYELKQASHRSAENYRNFKRQEKAKQKELRKAESLRKRKLKKIEKDRIKLNKPKKSPIKNIVQDHGPRIINSDTPFFRSLNLCRVDLFNYATGLTKNKEYAQDLIHEVILRFNDDAEHTLQEFRKLVYSVYSEELRIQRTQTKNEKVFLFLSDEKIQDANDLKVDIMTAIDSLSLKQKELANCILIDEMDYSEASQVTGIKESEINNAMQEVLLLLQHKLSKYKNYAA